ncbi:hypothetical protein VMCG_08982 [Cytospora schulzeri]|uniref:Uncharacterized protein n=1 Tax=Cytospora schulzeri TaxID=448051 RepID=A0A423VPQ0_9PEZI|nr:hypothetical protein VMCG_08982 [Valsa malicola]
MADEPSPTPSAPSQIHLTAVPAVVAWAGTDDQTHHLHHNERDRVTFDVRFNAASKTAFFKLRVPVKLKDFPDVKTPLFLYIHPDCVASMVYDGPDKTPDDIREKLGTDHIVCLRFDLNKPADMVVPRASSLAPRRQKGHGETLDALKFLARQTSINVYLAHFDSLFEVLLRALGAAVADGSLQAPDEAVDISGLYSGLGGEVVQLGDSCPPPSYLELGASPPPPPPHPKEGGAEASSARKRRRGSPSDIAGHGRGTSAHGMEATCRKIMQEMMSQFRQEERAYIKSELQQIKTEITEYVDRRLDRVADELDVYSVDEVDERLEEVKQYNEDRIDVKVEDRVDYVKLELEEYVEDQIAGAQERVLDRLRTASLSLEIQDDQ